MRLTTMHPETLVYLHPETLVYMQKTPHLHVVELRNVGDTNEHWVAGILELHLDAHFCVANHQAGIRILSLQLQKPCQGQWPAVEKLQLFIVSKVS